MMTAVLKSIGEAQQRISVQAHEFRSVDEDFVSIVLDPARHPSGKPCLQGLLSIDLRKFDRSKLMFRVVAHDDKEVCQGPVTRRGVFLILLPKDSRTETYRIEFSQRP